MYTCFCLKYNVFAIIFRAKSTFSACKKLRKKKAKNVLEKTQKRKNKNAKTPRKIRRGKFGGAWAHKNPRVGIKNALAKTAKNSWAGNSASAGLTGFAHVFLFYARFPKPFSVHLRFISFFNRVVNHPLFSLHQRVRKQ